MSPERLRREHHPQTWYSPSTNDRRISVQNVKLFSCRSAYFSIAVVLTVNAGSEITQLAIRYELMVCSVSVRSVIANPSHGVRTCRTGEYLRDVSNRRELVSCPFVQFRLKLRSQGPVTFHLTEQISHHTYPKSQKPLARPCMKARNFRDRSAQDFTSVTQMNGLLSEVPKALWCDENMSHIETRHCHEQV